MNKKGFTLIELLAYLALLGIILTIGLHASRDMMVTSFIQFRRVSEREIFSSAEKYVIDNDLSGKIYVSVIKLVELGYIKDMNDTSVRDKCVLVNKKKNRIKEIKLVDSCE
ncbi:MAG: type II secretion system protein [Bacilli bacterium]|nr:type II secretion system protein [Bacilli bacterium]